MRIMSSDLEDLIDGWDYWCPDETCRNRTFTIETESENFLTNTRNNDESKYLRVRVLLCSRCKTPLVIGTNTYYSEKIGWGAREQVHLKSESRMMAASIMAGQSLPYHPMEYVAFLEPSSERPLPSKLSKKIVKSFREAEFAVDKNKPISAGAALRNTVRLIVDDYGIKSPNFKDAIKELPFDKEYVDALVNMKIIGDDTLHYEEYEISDIKPALDSLYLAIQDHHARQERLAQLHKAVSTKASQRSIDKASK